MNAIVILDNNDSKRTGIDVNIRNVHEVELGMHLAITRYPSDSHPISVARSEIIQPGVLQVN
jgi:hypothetical protein